MKDVQGELDRRNIPLKHVGIKDLRWPIALKDKEFFKELINYAHYF